MRDFIASGRIADLVLAIMAVEAAFIFAVLRPAGSRSALGIAGNLVAGAGLVLALRCSLTGAEWPWIAGSLLLSMAGHVADMATRSWSR